MLEQLQTHGECTWCPCALFVSLLRTAHFAKVRDAIERELYLIRLSQARSTLLPPPPPPEPVSDVCDQQDGVPAQHAGAWGSTVWRKTSQVFLGPYIHHPTCQEAAEAAEEPSCDQAPPNTAGVSAFAGAVAQQQARVVGGMRHVSSADRIVEDAAVHVQVRQTSETRRSPLPTACQQGAAPVDRQHILQHQQLSSSAAPTPKVSWLQADLLKAHQHQQSLQQHQQQRQQQHSRADEHGQPSREHSFDMFGVERVPSILGPQQQHSRPGSKAGSRVGSRPGSRVGQGLMRSGRTGSKFSTSSTRHVSLPGMVAGVDGLLLQPEVLGATTAAEGQVRGVGYNGGSGVGSAWLCGPMA